MDSDAAAPTVPDELGQTLALLAKVFVFLGEQLASSAGLTAQQWAVLHQVGAAGDEGIQPSKLADVNRTSRANVTKFIARLSQLGLLAVQPSPVDGRQKRLRLTRTGSRTLTRLNAAKFERLRQALGAFSTDDKATFLALATKLLARLH